MNETVCLGWVLIIGMIGLGLLSIFSKDLLWEWTEANNRRRGITSSERTPEWETMTTVSGIACIVLAVIFLVVLLSQGNAG